jgi:lipopolysaccharide transport system ATP-binding protein
MNDSDILIKVENVSKKFCRSLTKSLLYGVSDIARDLNPFARQNSAPASDLRSLPSGLRPDEFWAVNDVSFELKRGECLGLIGRNGAGKTTLLKMLNGLIKPDKGRIEMHGRVGALIALGAGFNPILTGRENIYVNGSVLGLTKREINEKIEDIIDFADIREFIDTPVQSYSSGMQVRLGFAVAVILIKPDVLLLDEVLAVGDIGFTIKCLNAVRLLAEKAAVIFVSHNMQFVSAFCSRVTVMERGKTLLDAPNPADGIDRYYSMIDPDKQVSGSGDAEVLHASLVVNGDEVAGAEPQIPQGAQAHAVLSLRIAGPRKGAHLSVNIHDAAMTPIICFPVQDEAGDPLCVGVGQWRVSVPLGSLDLNAGKYSFVIALPDAHTSLVLCRLQGVLPFRIFASKSLWGNIVRPSRARLTSDQ